MYVVEHETLVWCQANLEDVGQTLIRILLCKAKRQLLLTFRVSSHCLLTLVGGFIGEGGRFDTAGLLEIPLCDLTVGKSARKVDGQADYMLCMDLDY